MFPLPLATRQPQSRTDPPTTLYGWTGLLCIFKGLKWTGLFLGWLGSCTLVIVIWQFKFPHFLFFCMVLLSPFHSKMTQNKNNTLILLKILKGAISWSNLIPFGDHFIVHLLFATEIWIRSECTGYGLFAEQAFLWGVFCVTMCGFLLFIVAKKRQ